MWSALKRCDDEPDMQSQILEIVIGCFNVCETIAPIHFELRLQAKWGHERHRPMDADAETTAECQNLLCRTLRPFESDAHGGDSRFTILRPRRERERVAEQGCLIVEMLSQDCQGHFTSGAFPEGVA